MNDTEKYLRTLKKEELIGVALGFRWFTEDEVGCPAMFTNLRFRMADCDDCNFECDNHLCWCKYFVWQYRNQKREEPKCQNRKN